MENKANCKRCAKIAFDKCYCQLRVLSQVPFVAQYEDPSIKIIMKALTKEDLSEAVDCIAKSFSEREPMSSKQAITRNEFKVFAYQVALICLQKQLSVVARIDSTNELIGCFLATDMCDDKELDFSRISPKFGPIFAMLEKGKIKVDSALAPGNCVHLWNGGIIDQFLSKGFSQIMSQAHSLLCASNNYKLIITECTGAQSLATARRSNYQEIDSIMYDTFDYNGQKPFESLSGGVVFMIQDLKAAALNPKL